jgi:hypothetical protein
VSFRDKVRKAAFCLLLAGAAFGGAPMCPEEIDDLMATMNQPKVAHQLPEDRETGDGLIRRLLEDVGNQDDSV